jgi:hypothetical protein
MSIGKSKTDYRVSSKLKKALRADALLLLQTLRKAPLLRARRHAQVFRELQTYP